MGKLWIRSQDGEQLVKTNVVRYSYFKDKLTNDELHIITNDYYDFGIYKSKERALEVLDEIQNLLFNKEIKIESLKVQQEKEYEKIKELIKNGTYHFIPESSVEYIEPSCIVYEMPKE